MKLERIVELVETSGDMSVRYSRKTATMPEKDKKRLREILKDDRLVFFDGAKMRTFRALSHEFQNQLNDPNPVEYLAVYYYLKEVIDWLSTRGRVLKHTMLIFENADQILCDGHKDDSVVTKSCEEFVRNLEKAGIYAARSFNDFDFRRGPLGFNAILLFDPKVKRPNVGNARHLKL
ncbi:MAG: hypothetical protein ABJO38_24930 [Stappiaceae bacterium]